MTSVLQYQRDPSIQTYDFLHKETKIIRGFTTHSELGGFHFQSRVFFSLILHCVPAIVVILLYVSKVKAYDQTLASLDATIDQATSYPVC